MIIRPVEQSDAEPLLNMLQESGQFDDDGLEFIRETLNSYFSGESKSLWYSADKDGLAGIAYCTPEVMTSGTWNLLMLWISPLHQRQGVGQALIRLIEKELKIKNARLLLVETSSQADFAVARTFYSKQGFTQEAKISNYYDSGDDKLIYTKVI